MTGTTAARTDRLSWETRLGLAVACALAGVMVRFFASALPVQLVTLGLGVGLIAAAFLLAWAVDAGEAVFSGGLVLAAVAIAGVLPEYAIEIHFAFTRQSQLVTANLTGATRLLLTCAVALPLMLAFLRRREGALREAIRLAPQRRLELGVLLVSAVFALQIVGRGSLTVVDGAVLLGLYVVYLRRVQGTPEEESAVVGVAAGLLSLSAPRQRQAVIALIGGASVVVVLVAHPFTEALLRTGVLFGVDPYLLIQSVVPIATEAPELVVVAVLVANRRPAQGLALLLASSVTQWTLGLGSLPFAFLAGGGSSLPLASREQLELGLTTSLTLFVVAALALLRPERVDAGVVATTFVLQLIYPTPFIRFAAALVLLLFALDLLIARRHQIPQMLRAVGLARRRRPRSSAA